MSKKDVSTCIVLEGDKILLLRRSMETRGGGLWNFPGGSVEPSEPLPIAAVRETQEEAGIIVDPESVSYLGHIEHDGLLIHFFITREYSGSVDINWESDDFVWASLDELEQLPFVGDGGLHPKLKDAIQDFMED